MTREEAIKWLKLLKISPLIYGEYPEAIDMAIEELQTDAVQGEWKIDEYGIYHCPYCHAINNTVYKSFCPNCGARMKGGDDE